MKYKIKILRQKSRKETPYWQSFSLETQLENATAATALSLLNSMDPLTDTDGNISDKIIWECSCLQKKCGACAMLINGRPGLACSVRLSELKGGEITLQPLKKFPVIADLMVDRGILSENLKTINAWLSSDAFASESKNDILYESSRCLQCGCCLEICPNFDPDGHFFGMASMVPAARLLEELPEKEKTELKKQYRRHIFGGCGKSLSCRHICPAGIDIEELLVNSNAIAVWKRFLGRKI
ncbi:MAG: 4Fe-4S dicluster domain-containing protein [Clostridia bacterium]|nr:4Fe-4S dicluster domain-containing protein [Clostridia bacterium]